MTACTVTKLEKQNTSTKKKLIQLLISSERGVDRTFPVPMKNIVYAKYLH